jgi:hypothetical protein
VHIWRKKWVLRAEPNEVAKTKYKNAGLVPQVSPLIGCG